MQDPNNIAREIESIHARNRRVEDDKAWETSFTRRAIIAVGTYIFAIALFLMINAPNPHIAALVPSVGFIISTLTMPYFKNFWLIGKKA